MAQKSKPRQDKRERPRVKTELLGRYMLADGREFPCTIIDVALGGIAVRRAVIAIVDYAIVVRVHLALIGNAVGVAV